jgi:high-affinity iron transporter
VYWIVVIIGFLAMRYNEKAGHWPLMKAKKAPKMEESDSSSESGAELTADKKEPAIKGEEIITPPPAKTLDV